MLPKFMSSWFWHAPEYFDKWRVFPRLFILTYLWLLFVASTWFMGLPVPSSAQSAFVSVIIGAGAAWFGLYVNSNGDSNKKIPKSVINPYDRAAIELSSSTKETKRVTTVTSKYKPRVIRRGTPTATTDSTEPQG